MEKIRLGRTNMMVSRLGFGGIPIQRVSENEAVAVIKRCLELGVSFLDTAAAYTNSEERIGKAISGQREGLILATKSGARTRNGVENDIKISLERLGVESIDLYQFHGVNDYDALDRVLAPNGPMAVVQEAKKAGIIKHIGITSHSMDLAREAVKSDRFETIMFPFNFVTSEPIDELLPLAKEHDVGFIAMKPMAGGKLENIDIALKYLLQFSDVVPVLGVQEIHEINEAIQVLSGPRQITKVEQREMQQLRGELGTRFCRRCEYCQPCTEKMPISTIMTTISFFKRLPPERVFSGWIADELEKAVNCKKCGDCEERCPYNLPIREMLEEYGNLYQTEKLKYQQQLMLEKDK